MEALKKNIEHLMFFAEANSIIANRHNIQNLMLDFEELVMEFEAIDQNANDEIVTLMFMAFMFGTINTANLHSRFNMDYKLDSKIQ